MASVPTTRRAAAVSAVVAALTMVLGLLATGANAVQSFPNAERVDVASFVDAGVRISERVYPFGASAAVIATTANFPDGLASSAVAADLQGPVLFTDPDSLPPGTAQELDRLLNQGASVFVMGGPAAVSDAVVQELRDAGYAVERIAGPTRLETAAAAAQRIGAPDATVLLARAFGGEAGSEEDRERGWVDSISCGGHAANTETPILLTETDRLSETTSRVLDEMGIREVIICGGNGAVSEVVVAELVAKGINTRRVSGENRAQTAIAVAEQLFNARTAAGRDFVIVNGYGNNYGYGLASSVLSAAEDRPILLVNVNEPLECGAQQSAHETLCYLESAGEQTANLAVIGAESVVSENVLEAAAAAAGGEPTATASPTETASPTDTATPSETATGPLAAPGNVVAADAGNDDGTRVRVTWNVVSGATGYNVYFGETGATQRFGAQPSISGGEKNTLVVTGLKKDTEYHFAVAAVRDETESGKSAVVKATPKDEAPEQVKDFRALPGNGQVKLTWTPTSAPDVTKYRITRQDSGSLNQCDPTGAGYGNAKEVEGGEKGEFVDTTVTNGNYYCYRIVAIDAAGQTSPYAQAGPARPSVGIPSVTVVHPLGIPETSSPTLVRYSAPTEIKWTLSDSDTPLDQIDVKIEFSDNSGVSYPVTIFNGKHTSTTAEGVYKWDAKHDLVDRDNDNARIRISVFDPQNNAGEDHSGNFQTRRAPSKVTDVSALGGNSRVELKWSAVPETAVSSYRVLRKDVNVTARTDQAQACGDPNPREAEREIAIVQALAYSDPVPNSAPNGQDVRYCYRIQAIRPGDAPDGAPSDTASANPDAVKPSVALVKPGSNETIREGTTYTIVFSVAVPAGSSADRVTFRYCVDYDPGVPNVTDPSCRSSWQPIGTKKPVSAGDGQQFAWQVPNIDQGDQQTGAVEALIYQTTDQPDDNPSGRSVATGIRFR